jgi:hypothetical protein
MDWSHEGFIARSIIWEDRMLRRYARIRLGVLALFYLPAQGSFAANLPTTEQVQGILTLCAGGVTKEVQTALQGKIEIWKRAAQL